MALNNTEQHISSSDGGDSTPVENANREKDAESAMPHRQPFPEMDLRNGIVGWDGQDDPENPRNFSSRKRWTLLSIISGMTFVTPFASSMLSPAVTFVSAEFGITNQTLLSLSVSIYLLGYSFGPLLLAPMSEIYGRRIVLSLSNWFFVIWQIGCALSPNITSLIIFRFLGGMGGSGCLTLGAGLIADLFPIERRGLAASFWSLGLLVGPVLGPVCGGFISETIGWRWIFWTLLIVGTSMSALIDLLNEETYAIVIIQRKKKRLAAELGRTDLRNAYKHDGKEESVLATLKIDSVRPVMLFCTSPIVFLLSMYLAVEYGLLYLFFTTIPIVFPGKYGFSPGISGLTYLGIGLGFLLGLSLNAYTSDRMMMESVRRNNGKFEPEMRLPFLVFYSTFCTIGFFWYGWTVDKGIHWIVPIIGMVPFGFGLMGLWLCIQTYVIDSYHKYAASANAAITASRSLLGATLPLAGPKLFETLGLGWGNSLLGFISLAFVPVPVIFLRYGKRIREKYDVQF
ncbi:putative arabinose efflux permease, MFS family [Geosmithia morbida]|uniref:Arabinose efflux permease, MFS family n=1 Tax=Geosmithia morbida TaxID=1094350 RepID=A0A9P4YQR3_9HYPO|nr:putative arabinose efflux permease, MFS family [Geosmithia morbida]KAF4121388.1 putative arabinose efflux permease, MFS family [Geosmithia morbida]